MALWGVRGWALTPPDKVRLCLNFLNLKFKIFVSIPLKFLFKKTKIVFSKSLKNLNFCGNERYPKFALLVRL